MTLNRTAFAEYIAAFNRGDEAGYAAYYAPNVQLSLGGRLQLNGRQAVLDHYRGVRERVLETLRLGQLVLDDGGIAAELDTQFLALLDWPDFMAGPLQRGDRLQLVSFVFYRVEHGLFTDIRTARLGDVKRLV